MVDRVLRDEIWESDRYLDLSTDTQRLAFIRLLSEADDFGNCEGHLRRIYRTLAKVMQVRSEEDAAKVLDALVEVDLIRFYEIVEEAEGETRTRRLIHIPRFRSHRQYHTRKVPPSPWDDKDVALGKTRRVINHGLAKNVVTTSLPRSSGNDATSQPRSNHVAEGVGVGVGENTLSSHRQVKTEPASYPQAPPARADEVGTRAGRVSAMLRSLGVRVTAMHPTVIELVEAGATDAQLRDGVERCRFNKPAPEEIPASYFRKVMIDVMNPGKALTPLVTPKPAPSPCSWTGCLEHADRKFGETWYCGTHFFEANRAELAARGMPEASRSAGNVLAEIQRKAAEGRK